MEIYGVYLAATETEPLPQFLAFKSVYDFAEEKTDNWREYAAYTAAKYCYEFIMNDIGEFIEP